MSILRALSEIHRTGGSSAAGILLLALTMMSLAVGVLAGVIPPRRANGPDRIPAGRSPWILLAVLFGSVAAYLFTASIYATFKYPAPPHGAPHANVQQTSIDIAFLSTAPALVGFLALLVGDRAAKDAVGQDLGIAPQRFSAGVARGLLGTLIIIPPLFLLETILENIYRLIHYAHPTEHPLLHVLGERPSKGVVAAIVVGACVIAPLFEELVFRGHIQTLIRRLLCRLTSRRVLSTPPLQSQGTLTAIPLSYRAGPSPSPCPPPSTAHTWAAIVLTSMLFASIHPVWSQPIIFVLALTLGYAYERTGNLWTSITMHAAFNTISTAIFLLTLAPH